MGPNRLGLNCSLAMYEYIAIIRDRGLSGLESNVLVNNRTVLTKPYNAVRSKYVRSKLKDKADINVSFNHFQAALIITLTLLTFSRTIHGLLIGS